VQITGGTLVGSIFDLDAVLITGETSDYTLDRNTGEVKLAVALSAGDKLSAGSISTRAFAESDSISPTTISAPGARMWFVIDGDAVRISTGVTTSTALTISDTAMTAGGRRIRIDAGTDLFTSVVVGDWAVFWDPEFVTIGIVGAFRICRVDATFEWFEIEMATSPTTGPVTPSAAGLVVVRSEAIPQLNLIPTAANYTATSVVSQLNTTLVGAHADVFATNYVRVRTSSFEDITSTSNDTLAGDIALVAADTNAQALTIPVSDAIANLTGHLASVESGASEAGTPDFHQAYIDTAASETDITYVWSPDPLSLQSDPEIGGALAGGIAFDDSSAAADARYGSVNGFVAFMANTPGALQFELRTGPEQVWVPGDRMYFASPFNVSDEDQLVAVIDGDTETKRFVIPMWRTLKTVGTVYAASNDYKDADNSDQSLAIGFGAGSDGFDFSVFAVFMPARVLTHSATASKRILWRYFRLGPDGNRARVKYTLPDAADTALDVVTDHTSGLNTGISIQLGSGAERTGYSLSDTSHIGVTSLAPVSGISTIYYIVNYPVSSAQRTAGVTTLVLTMPTGVLSSGLTVGQTYNFVSSNGGIPSGDKTLLTVTDNTPAGFTTITYNDGTVGNAGPFTPGGTFYLGPGETPSFSGASIAQGDFAHTTSALNVDPDFQGQTFRIVNNVSTTPSWLEASVENFPTNYAGAVTLSTVGDSAGLSIYTNLAQTATAIAAAVNVLAAADATVPVTATVTGTGLGTIDRASYEEAAAADTWFSLVDGLNYISTSTAPGLPSGDYTFSFKLPIDAGLATNSDWANETVKIMPRSAKNMTEWLAEPTVSGLSSVCNIERSHRGHRVQIASLTPGSSGSVQVQGGTANAVTAAVVGSPTIADTYLVSTVEAADTQGIFAGQWVSIDNTVALPKDVFSATTAISTIADDGNNTTATITFSAGPAVYTNRTAPVDNVNVRIEPQGKFIAISDTDFDNVLDLSLVEEGDWVYITTATTPTATDVADENTGIFKVVRVSQPSIHYTSGGTFWIENVNGSYQHLAAARFQFMTYDSIMPGDKLKISTTVLGAGNVGTWEVANVGLTFTNTTKLQLKVSATETVEAFTGPVVLGASGAQLFQVIEDVPSRLIKQVLSIAPNQTDGDLHDIKFTTDQGSTRVSATAGSVISVLDKLDFPSDLAEGIDGYRHSIGLIGEVNKVIYGDPADTASYPGVAAAGATVNIQGPLVKRIQVALAVRIASGIQDDIEDKVKSAVAAVVNRTAVGQFISLSDIVAAVARVGGVVSVVMINPVMASGSDVIAVQPNEKPLIQNVDQDVQVSFIGTT
jgi:hypothetical protein